MLEELIEEAEQLKLSIKMDYRPRRGHWVVILSGQSDWEYVGTNVSLTEAFKEAFNAAKERTTSDVLRRARAD